MKATFIVDNAKGVKISVEHKDEYVMLDFIDYLVANDFVSPISNMRYSVINKTMFFMHLEDINEY